MTLVFFGLLTVATYFPVVFGKIPFPRDVVLQFAAWDETARRHGLQTTADIGDLVTAFYPARAFAARTIREGALPLWNPYYLGGAPFAANAQSALFYPPNFLYYVLPLPTAWALCLMIRLFLSGIFMTMFIRSIGGSKAGAIFSGTVFSLCGFMTGWQGYAMSDAAAWLPLICYAVISLQRDPSRLNFALAGFAFAMPMLAGHPETAAHVTLVAVALAVSTAAWSKDWRFLLRSAGTGVFAIGLASVQIIPTVEWLFQLSSPLAQRWPPLLRHDLLAWVSRDVLRAPNSAGLWIPESAPYIGMITLLLAPLGLFHRVRKFTIFLFALTIVALTIAYGIEPVHSLVGHTPVLSALKNARLVFVAAFGLAALAGLGVSALTDQSFTGRRLALAVAAAAIVFVAALLLVYRLQLATQFRVETMRRPSFSRGLLFAALAPILMWRLGDTRTKKAFPVAACGLVAFDLLTFSYGYTRFSGRNEIFPPAPVFDFLTQHTDPAQSRIAELGIPYPSNANVIYKIAAVDGYETHVTRRQQLFWLDYTGGRSDGIFLDTKQLLQLKDRKLDLLNVKYLVVESRSDNFNLLMDQPRFRLAYKTDYVGVFENTSVLPRAFTVPLSSVRVTNEASRELEILRTAAFNPEREAVMSVQITHHIANKIALHTSTTNASILVIGQTYYPGWKATIDGRQTDVVPVDLSLTGISLPAGIHEVQLVFDPMSFKVGAVLSGVGVAVLFCALAPRINGRRKSI